jgi:hypothetical protein
VATIYQEGLFCPPKKGKVLGHSGHFEKVKISKNQLKKLILIFFH